MSSSISALDLDAEFEQDLSNFVERRSTLLPVEDEIDKLTLSKQPDSLVDYRGPSSTFVSIPPASNERSQAMKERH